MKFISIYAPKGGTGKSTTTCTLINELTLVHKLKCMLIESDDQMTISDYRQLDKRNPEFTGMEEPYPIFRVLPDKIVEFVKQDPKKFDGYDICFIELPGILDVNIIAALRSCDGILMPLIPNKADKLSLIRALKLIEKNVFNYKVENNQEFACYALQIRFKKNQIEHNAFRIFLEESLKMEVFETKIRDLDVYANKINSMVSLSNANFNKAFKEVQEEVTQLGNEFLEKFEIAVKA